MSLSSGSRLGPYEIVSPIGAGGMGEVYRARDVRLHREVAVKVLPGSLADDPDRLRRFEQEARAASALNHPGNRLEKLSGKRMGQHGIRINDQWRICFEWRDGDAHQVEIVDYHMPRDAEGGEPNASAIPGGRGRSLTQSGYHRTSLRIG
jgi:plasmid maintenance system killer protein